MKYICVCAIAVAENKPTPNQYKYNTIISFGDAVNKNIQTKVK